MGHDLDNWSRETMNLLLGLKGSIILSQVRYDLYI